MPKKLLLGISLASLALGWLSEPAAPAAAAAAGGGRSSTKSDTDLGIAPGHYSGTFCVSETILVPVIVSITTLTNGHELLDCRGQAGLQHRIQGAPDLHTWTDLGTNTAVPDGTVRFEDANTAGVVHRFYRLVTP